MKAKPMRMAGGNYHPCSETEATHVELNMPCPIATRMIPIVTFAGLRQPGPCWVWNFDTEFPTLTPSIKTEGGGTGVVCHSFVTGGRVAFCHDSTHENAGKTLELLEVD